MFVIAKLTELLRYPLALVPTPPPSSSRSWPSAEILVAMPSSIIVIGCLLSSSVHALLVPATRPGMVTNHPAVSRLGTPVMKGSFGRRVLLLAPLAPLLAAPASALAVPSVEDKRKADREKVAKDRAALQKKSQDRVRREVGDAKKLGADKARKQLANVKKANANDRTKFNQQRIAKLKEDAKIAKIRANKQRRAQGKKTSKGGLGLPLTILLVVGGGVGVLALAGEGDGIPTEGATAGGGGGGGAGVVSWYDAGKRL